MKSRKITSVCLIIILLLTSVMTGCTNNGNGDSVKLTQDELVNLSKGDFEESAYNIAEALYDLPQDYVFELELGYDAKGMGIETFDEIFEIYEDSDLTCLANANCTYDDESHVIMVEPSTNSNMSISPSNSLSDALKVYMNNEDDSYLHQADENGRWGNCSKYYFVLYRDMETGELLDKPAVTVCNMRGELDTPTNFRYSQTENGEARFTWDAVEGAENYLIVQCKLWADDITLNDVTKNVTFDTLTVIGMSDTTEWICEGDGSSQNYDFMTYDLSQTNEELIAKKGKEVEKDSLAEELGYNTFFGVIAISKEGNSVISSTYSIDLLAKTLPYNFTSVVSAETEGENEKKDYYYDTFEDLPSYIWIIMCDGTAVQRVINYDIEDYSAGEGDFWDFDEDGEIICNTRDAVILSYGIEGTAMVRRKAVCVLNYDESTLTDDLQTLQDRQDSLKIVGGNKEVTVTVGEEDRDIDEDVDVENYEITANSALTKYLALNMINGVEVIDVSEFNEAQDEEYLVDALFEAMYQNPLVFGLKDIGLSRNGKLLYIEYENVGEERKSMQQAIQKEVKKVVSEIITDDMTELEKENAINDYLCEIGEYDYDALENAEKYDMMEVDEEFYNSFNAYGILIDGVGVCASYSAAFKLLCDEAGLDCIVVTGYLEGTYSHAWNKVKIDGEWQIIDVTNNDNEGLFNALMNIPDYASEGVLVEDDSFVMNKCVSNYSSTATEYEYYRINDKYFDIGEIANSLADELKNSDDAALRTEYSLNDGEFNEILKEVRRATGEKVYGYYWMGVVYVTRNAW